MTNPGSRSESSPLTWVFIALMVLLAAAIAVRWLPHAGWATAISLLLSAAKTLLVMLFFMHLIKTRNSAILTAAMTGLLLFGIFALLLASDYLTR